MTTPVMQPVQIVSGSAVPLQPWWRRALGAFGASLGATGLATLALAWVLSPPWQAAVPSLVGMAVFFTYHPAWWAPQYRRATVVHLVFVLALGLAVLALNRRLGWL